MIRLPSLLGSEVPSHKPCSHISPWDVKEPKHYSKRVGDVVPRVVVSFRSLHYIVTHHGMGRFSGLINGLIVAAIGALRMLMSEPTAKKQCKEVIYVCSLPRDIYIDKCQ